MRGKCKFLWDSGAPAVIHLRHPGPEGGVAIYLYSFYRTMFQQYIISFFEVCLGLNYMENKVGTL